MEIESRTLIFHWDGVSWLLEETLWFNCRRAALSADGEHLAVRSWDDDIHILARGPSGWVEEAVVDPGRPEIFDKMALDSERLAVAGLPPFVANGGAIWLYRRGNGDWSGRNLLMTSVSASYYSDDLYASDVGLSGSIVVSAAPRDSSGATGLGGNPYDDSAPNSGAVWLMDVP